MSSPRTEFDLLLEAPDSFAAEMARELLAQAGIPTYLHGRDRDLAELGRAVHNSLTRPDLYVPKGRLAEARGILDAVWDEESLSDEIALETPVEDEVQPLPPASRRTIWSALILATLIVAVFWIYYQDFIVHPRAIVP